MQQETPPSSTPVVLRLTHAEALQKCNELQAENLDLRNMLAAMQEQIKILQTQINQAENKNQAPMEHDETDDDDSALLESPKNIKKKCPGKPVNTAPKETTSHKNAGDNNKRREGEYKPPPVFVNAKDCAFEFTQELAKVGIQAKSALMTSGDTKISTEKSDDYRQLIALLEKKIAEGSNIKYYTYQPKVDKNYVIIIRNLPAETDKKAITDELLNLGHAPMKVENIYKKTQRDEKGMRKLIPRALFRVELVKEDKNKELFNITELLNFRVKIEVPYKIKQVVQCQRCQLLGHTQRYCVRDPICVKCAESHWTSKCTKSPKSKATCALCGAHGKEGHPASYCGCPAYQRALEKKYPKKELVADRIRTETEQQPKPNPSSTTKPKSYAQVARMKTKHVQAEGKKENKADHQKSEAGNSKQNQDKDPLRQILAKFDSIEKRMSTLENQLRNSTAKKTSK